MSKLKLHKNVVKFNFLHLPPDLSTFSNYIQIYSPDRIFILILAREVYIFQRGRMYSNFVSIENYMPTTHYLSVPGLGKPSLKKKKIREIFHALVRPPNPPYREKKCFFPLEH